MSRRSTRSSASCRAPRCEPEVRQRLIAALLAGVDRGAVAYHPAERERGDAPPAPGLAAPSSKRWTTWCRRCSSPSSPGKAARWRHGTPTTTGALGLRELPSPAGRRARGRRAPALPEAQPLDRGGGGERGARRDAHLPRRPRDRHRIAPHAVHRRAAHLRARVSPLGLQVFDLLFLQGPLPGGRGRVPSRPAHARRAHVEEPPLPRRARDRRRARRRARAAPSAAGARRGGPGGGRRALATGPPSPGPCAADPSLPQGL